MSEVFDAQIVNVTLTLLDNLWLTKTQIGTYTGSKAQSIRLNVPARKGETFDYATALGTVQGEPAKFT